MKDLPEFNCNANLLSDDIFKYMMKVKEESISQPVIAGSIKIDDIASDSDTETDDERNIEDQSVPATMGGTSNLTCVLSQERKSMDNNASTDPMISYTVKEHVKPMIDLAIGSCKTQAQIMRLRDGIRDCYYKNLGEEAHKKNNRGRGISVFGDVNCKKKKIRRHKFLYEYAKK